MIPNVLPSITRTLVPIIVGWLLSLPIATPVIHFLNTDSVHARQAVSGAVAGLLAIVYYAVVHFLETRFPQFSVLLGSTKQPLVYATPTIDGQASNVSTLPFDASEGTGLLDTTPRTAPLLGPGYTGN